ncbi:hypothetical protein BpHYR1_015210 [Brachionus plicatilis]|uniref:Uncharacterized protein n=1 Tax=Brachionus plicatilis TaxID=10195 RepID=A0A3M7PH63_BRAPC|nr:hypothetical protein BpHYR1_015210 [Brachionus plicatilis]
MKEVAIIYRWFMKYPNVTISNLALFSASGDTNDAAFPYPSDSLKSYKFQTQNKLYGGQLIFVNCQLNMTNISSEKALQA